MSEEENKHPSYVTVRFSRRSGNPGRLFGSNFDNHSSYITLEVARATLIREEGREDHYHASLRGDVVEVDLSAMQFAELLTTMNVGTGTPGTLRYLNGKQVENPPDLPHETERFRSDFEVQSKEFLAKITSEVKEIRAILDDKKSLLKGDRERIASLLNKIVMELSSNMPFHLELFQEATDKLTNAAKAEVDAFMTNVIQQAGLQALKANGEAVDQLPEKTGDQT